jgi:hypothetical protein
MMNLNVHNPFDRDRPAAHTAPFGRRLLPGQSETSDPIHVDVHVRRYSESLPVVRPMPGARPKGGPLPVGTFLDCYL